MSRRELWWRAWWSSRITPPVITALVELGYPYAVVARWGDWSRRRVTNVCLAEDVRTAHGRGARPGIRRLPAPRPEEGLRC